MASIFVMKIVESTTVDGPGLRNSVYCSGCVNKCPGCHNSQTWDILAGKPMTVEAVAQRLLADDFCDVTFTGGDPMFQAEPFAALARKIKLESDKNIWCYTGYTLEEVLADSAKRALMAQVDVLVEGRYVAALRDTRLLFRGSSNQRLVDCRATLRKGLFVPYEYDPYPW